MECRKVKSTLVYMESRRLKRRDRRTVSVVVNTYIQKREPLLSSVTKEETSTLEHGQWWWLQRSIRRSNPHLNRDGASLAFGVTNPPGPFTKMKSHSSCKVVPPPCVGTASGFVWMVVCWRQGALNACGASRVP